MLKQICRCCSPSPLRSSHLPSGGGSSGSISSSSSGGAARDGRVRGGGRGRCEYVKQRKCEFPYLLLLLPFLSPPLKPQSSVLYLEMCLCEVVAQRLYVLRDGRGIFFPQTSKKHSCDPAPLLLLLLLLFFCCWPSHRWQSNI